MQKASTAPDHDDIFDELKKAVVNEAMKRHKWEDKVYANQIKHYNF